SYYKGGGGGTREGHRRRCFGDDGGRARARPPSTGCCDAPYEQARFGWPAPGALDHTQLTDALGWLELHVKLTVSPAHVQSTPSDCVKPGRVSQAPLKYES